MAKDWYLIDRPQIYNGGFEGQEWKNYAQDGFDELLHTSMLHDKVEFITSDFKKRVPGLAIIQGVTEDSQDKFDERQILVPIGTLQHFAYVKFKEDIWLIAAEPSDNKFYEKAPLKLCNNQLRWQDPLTKKIIEYWFWCEDGTQYSSGIFQGNVIIKYEKQYNVCLPFDYNTKNLHDGMRFMLEKSNNLPLVYKLTKYDGVVYNNRHTKLLNLTLTQTVYDEETDNADIMIADYYEKPEQEETDYNATIDYVVDEIALSSSAKFTLIERDKKGRPIDIDFEYEWQISECDFNEENLTLTIEDNNITVSVANDKALIGQYFTLSVIAADDDSTVVASVKVQIVPLW